MLLLEELKKITNEVSNKYLGEVLNEENLYKMKQDISAVIRARIGINVSPIIVVTDYEQISIKDFEFTDYNHVGRDLPDAK